MEKDQLIDVLDKNDFHVDPIGRIVIDNPELLSSINGAMMRNGVGEEMNFNGGCSNSGCG